MNLFQKKQLETRAFFFLKKDTHSPYLIDANTIISKENLAVYSSMR